MTIVPKSIWVEVPERPKKSQLQKKVERLIKKREEIGSPFNDLELSVFNALGNVEWDESKVHWLMMQQFDYMYRKCYPKGRGYSI